MINISPGIKKAAIGCLAGSSLLLGVGLASPQITNAGEAASMEIYQPTEQKNSFNIEHWGTISGRPVEAHLHDGKIDAGAPRGFEAKITTKDGTKETPFKMVYAKYQGQPVFSNPVKVSKDGSFILEAKIPRYKLKHGEHNDKIKITGHFQQ